MSRNPIQSKYLRYYELTTTETLDFTVTEDIVENDRESVSDVIVEESVSNVIVEDNKNIEGTMI